MSRAKCTLILATYLVCASGCGQTSSDSVLDGGRADGAADSATGGTGNTPGAHPCGAGSCSADEACWCKNPVVCCPMGALCPSCAPPDGGSCSSLAGNWILVGCIPEQNCFVVQTGCSVDMKCVDGSALSGTVAGSHVDLTGGGLSCSGNFANGSLQGSCTGSDAGPDCYLGGTAAN